MTVILARLGITPGLIGDLGELYFKHLCLQRGFGYIRLEDIQTRIPSVQEFKFGFERIPVIVPPTLIEEITRISKPTTVNGTQSFVFDFLTCKLYETDSRISPNIREPKDFCWVEVKAGQSHLSSHQYEVAQTCKIRFSIFKIANVMSSPRAIQIDWQFDSKRFSEE